MESNSSNSFGTQDNGNTTSGSFGASTGSQGGSQGGGASLGGTGGTGGTGGFSRDDAAETASGLADRAKGAAGTAGEKISDVGSTVRDRAGNLKSTLADALESGAERLRAQGSGGGQFGGTAATGGSSSMVTETPQLGAAANQLAGGLQASADWLRDADIDGLRTSIEGQVKNHPGRTLAVAVGLGYLLGKALRK